MQPGTQLPLGGFAAPPQTDRLFFALYPDAEAVRRIVELAEAMRAKYHQRGNPLRANLLHVTLYHLGDHAGLPSSLLAGASAAAAGLAMAPFKIGFDRIASFAGRARKRPCVLRCVNEHANAPLRAFRQALGQRLRTSGLDRYVEPGFTPHVTLLYDERTLAPEAAMPVGWEVREFVLIHSLLGRTEHRLLGRWSLNSAKDG